MGIREHYRNIEIRKAELDPTTFANDDEALIAWAEELQARSEPYNPWGMRLLCVWCLFALCVGGWALWTLAASVFN